MYVIIINYGQLSTIQISHVLTKLNIKHKCLLPHEKPYKNVTHIILSGGDHHVYEKKSYKLPKWIIASDKPVLGICYGMQLIASHFKGKVQKMKQPEKGLVEVIEMVNDDIIKKKCWMNRLDHVTHLPLKFNIIGITYNNDIAAFTDHYKWWAIQYHPESSHATHEDVFIDFFKK